MNEEKVYTLNDGKWRLIGIPALSIAIMATLNFDAFFKPDKAFFISLLSCVLLTLVFWEGNRFVIIRMRRAFPDYGQTRRRLLAEALLALLFVLVVSVLMDWCFYLPFYGQSGFTVTFRTSIVPTMLVYLIYEAVYFFEAWRQHVRKSEALERERVQSQLEVLKNQLDPHFLFNSMNTLAALIDDENTDAQDYLEHLADLYRYVLVSRERNTVLLDEELSCVEAYVYLNKIRFRQNLVADINLSAALRQQYIIPLSLQMLIENAIKHNSASRENPLIIRIYEDGPAYLAVENNISEKVILEKSTKVGLKNIANRYRLLSDRDMEIIRTDGFFKVRIPVFAELR